MRSPKLQFAAFLAGLTFCAACGEGLEPTSRITKARILGAEYSVQEDPSRTSARPGETLDVTLLVTQPGAPTLNSWAFLVCEPAPTAFGAPRCAEGEPIAVFSVDTPVEEPPAFSVRIPEDAEGDLLYVGGVCMGGALTPLDDDEASTRVNPCATVGVGRLVTGAIRVQAQEDDAFENHAPQIERITLDGEPWSTQVAATDAETCDPSLRRVSFSGEEVVLIEVFPSAESREALPMMGTVDVLEELPVAFFATERGLVQFYSVIDDRRAHAQSEFDTRDIPVADAERIPAEGRVVRFDFVMRDDRGGVARESRALCLIR